MDACNIFLSVLCFVFQLFLLLIVRLYCNRKFVWDACGPEDTFDKQAGGVPGISVTFFLKNTTNIFVHISEIRVIVHPYT
jgi:hypothetical protein